MGFMDKMKAANGMNFGKIESPDFPNGVLILKDKQLTIINGAMNGPDFERVVKQSDIRVFKLIGCGGMWAKYYLEFKDGKSGIITQEVITQSQKQGTSASMAPIERLIKYVDPSLNDKTFNTTQINTVSSPEVSMNSFNSQMVGNSAPEVKEQAEKKRPEPKTVEPTINIERTIKAKPSNIEISKNAITINDKVYSIKKVMHLSVIGSDLRFQIEETEFIVELDSYSDASKMYDEIFSHAR